MTCIYRVVAACWVLSAFLISVTEFQFVFVKYGVSGKDPLLGGVWPCANDRRDSKVYPSVSEPISIYFLGECGLKLEEIVFTLTVWRLDAVID